MIWKALLTGSRVYGTPRPDSDVDIVLRVPADMVDAIAAAADAAKIRKYPENDSTSLWFDKLNLICVTSDKVFETWAAGTAVLMARGSVTRDEAIAEFASRGITPSLKSDAPEVPEKVATLPTTPAGATDADSIPF